jgi:hypothetical protein
MEGSTILEHDINSESVGKCTPHSLSKSSTPLSTMSSIASTPRFGPTWDITSPDFKSSLIARERFYKTDVNFEKQTVITGKMRVVLFDWM